MPTQNCQPKGSLSTKNAMSAASTGTRLTYTEARVAPSFWMPLYQTMYEADTASKPDAARITQARRGTSGQVGAVLTRAGEATRSSTAAPVGMVSAFSLTAE